MVANILIRFLREFRADLALATSRAKFDSRLGFAFLNHPANTPLMQSGEFELAESLWLDHALDDESVFINIGANVGYHALKSAARGVPTLAFEPDRNNLKFLLANVKANQFENFEIFPVALANSDGFATLFGASTGASLVRGWAKQAGNEIVPAFKLDTLMQSRFVGRRLVVVCDVEGAELSVLLGALETLTTARGVLMLLELERFSQHHPNGENPEFFSTLELLSSKGFSPFLLDQNGSQVPTTFGSLMEEASHQTSRSLVFSRGETSPG